MVSRVHSSSRSPERCGREQGDTLSVIYSTEYAATKATSRPTGVLPLLVILFIVSYGILTMLVFEQGQTIESQRGLIRQMLKDSTQLAAMKGKLARDDGKHPHEQAMQADPQADRKTLDSSPTANAAAGVKGKGSDPALNKRGSQNFDKETKQP